VGLGLGGAWRDLEGLGRAWNGFEFFRGVEASGGIGGACRGKEGLGALDGLT
jgi:hypothetical protein